MVADIKKIGVIGSGVMGAQLAALFAGSGARVELLDVVPGDLGPGDDARARDRLATAAIARLAKQKPAPFYLKSDLARIRAGNLEDHLERFSACDWVLEAVVERLDVKRALYARLASVMNDRAILTSNTSGLLRRMLVEGMPDKLAHRFLITHYFNPPRYMKLLELVAGDADDDAVEAIAAFNGKALGKGVVQAKDTPLFIANRIGVFYVLDVMHRLIEQGWPIEAIDAVLGKPAARPKSGVFRTVDMAGIDTLTYVAAELVKHCPGDEGIARCRIPQFLQHMVVKGLVGDKAGGGFYRKDRATGKIEAFDPAALDYRPRVNIAIPSIAEAARIEDPGERLQRVVFADDQAGEIAWPVISRMIAYAAHRVPEIADGVAPIDAAMRWGYHWELGPFETWDALGVKKVADRLEAEGRVVPPLVEELLREGHSHFYEWRGHRRMVLDVAANRHAAIAGSGERVTLRRLKEVGRLVVENAGAAIVDVGDGVFACEFRTKMNAIDGEIVAMVEAALDRVESEGVGLLIANEGEQFSVGANLLLVLMAAREKRWGEIDTMVREFQAMNQRLRFSPKPAMAVPFGMALGGGCEICLACATRTAAVESYIGLVEVGAGVIPAGGGCKNLILAMEQRPHIAGGSQPKVSAAFELIATARVAGSAREAQALGFLAAGDRIVMDRELLLHEAKTTLLGLAKNYAPPAVRNDIPLPGRGGEQALANAVRGFVAKGQATEHDALIARKLARVLAGGDEPTVHEAGEEHLLDLEREAFLSLCGEEKTLARMAALLQTGKPLRN